MGSVIGDLLPLALGVAISPVPIIAVILMLLAPRATASSVGFAIGWVVGIVVVTTVTVVVASSADLAGEGDSGPSTGASYSPEAMARAMTAAEQERTQFACRDLVDRIAEDIRLSLTFYRTEYDRESLPRYAIGGWTELPVLGRWLSQRIGIPAPLEIMDPFRSVEVRIKQAVPAPESGDTGPQYLQAFGLALRGL